MYVFQLHKMPRQTPGEPYSKRHIRRLVAARKETITNYEPKIFGILKFGVSRF